MVLLVQDMDIIHQLEAVKGPQDPHQAAPIIIPLLLEDILLHRILLMHLVHVVHHGHHSRLDLWDLQVGLQTGLRPLHHLVPMICTIDKDGHNQVMVVRVPHIQVKTRPVMHQELEPCKDQALRLAIYLEVLQLPQPNTLLPVPEETHLRGNLHSLANLLIQTNTR